MASTQTHPSPTPAATRDNKDSAKTQESLFGPSIGPVNSGPAWTTMNAKKVVNDELTADVVKGWIERSKEPGHTTTTVQALVNLKRPTIRLSPLSHAHEDSHPDFSSQHQHGLEFEYDCDAPKCGIYVHALVHPDHPESTKGFAPALTNLLVYESVTTGGFGKTLKIEDGATLDLERYEYIPARATSSNATDTSGEKPPIDADEKHDRDRRKRFTIPFKKRQNHSVTGPALAVVDVEPSTSEQKEVEDDAGVRVTIRLVALDEQGTELASPNEQVTYLHVVRFGAPPLVLEAGEEDPRPWVVKVVKREATIGPHTFHLHEIYGLSSSSTSTAAPTAPLPVSHTYPPTDSGAQTSPAANEETVSECLVCLSSPREVVLLPCRHLVACKECALNMVEFGAGGNITHAEEPAEPTEPAPMPADENQAEAGTSGQAEPAPIQAPAPAPVPAPRRKRKAKGWFCPVCRQPYTSLLRITASPPPEPSKLPSTDTPAVINTPVATQQPTQTSTRHSTPLLSHLRPAFLRGNPRHTPNGPERQV